MNKEQVIISVVRGKLPTLLIIKNITLTLNGQISQTLIGQMARGVSH